MRGNNMKNPPMKINKSETLIHREVKGVAERKTVHVHSFPSSCMADCE
jgi:hypothetical protein